MNRRDQKRFEELHARVLSSLALTKAQRSEYDALLVRFPELAIEVALFDELADMEARPNTSSRALAEAALVHFENEKDAETEAAAAGGEGSREAALEGKHGTTSGAKVKGVAGGGLRVWTRLLGRPTTPSPDGGSDPGRSRRMVGAAAVAGACAVVALNTLWRQDRDADLPVSTRAELVFISGEVTLEGASAQGSPRSDAYGRLLQPDQVVRVDEGHACFVLDPGISVCLDGNSRLRIGQLDGGRRRFQLIEGQVALSLDHQPRGFDVTVEAAGVESTAVGTSFLVRRTGERVEMNVLEGAVKVQTGAAGEHHVHAHQSLVVEGSKFKSTTLTRTQEAPAWAVIDVRRLWQEHAAATLHVSGGREGAEVWLDGQFIGRTPLTTLVPSGRRQVVVRDEHQELLSREGNFHSGRRTSFTVFDVAAPAPHAPSTSAPAPSTTPALGPPTPTTGASPESKRSAAPTSKAQPAERPPFSAAALLHQAQRLLRAKRFSEATQRYQELLLAHPKSSEARTGLVTLAQLQLEQARDPKSALQLLQTYLAGGEGAVAPEARYLRIRALDALGFVQRELEAIADFLARHPNSLHASTLRDLRTELNSKKSGRR